MNTVSVGATFEASSGASFTTPVIAAGPAAAGAATFGTGAAPPPASACASAMLELIERAMSDSGDTDFKMRCQYETAPL